MGKIALIRCLVNELGADVNRPAYSGVTPLCIIAEDGRLADVRCLVVELGADVNQGCCMLDGFQSSPLFAACHGGHLALVRYMVEELSADVNQALHDGRTALMAAAKGKHFKVIRFLIKSGADLQASASDWGTAVSISKAFGAPEKQITYLEAKAHCSNPGCSGAGLKKCAVCKQAHYCGKSCQVTHWTAHKADCKAKE
jgi:ankyrin repeat protein